MFNANLTFCIFDGGGSRWQNDDVAERWGSATRIGAKNGPDCRYQELRLTVGLKGVPGGLAPTWEQWFDPSRPIQTEKRR